LEEPTKIEWSNLSLNSNSNAIKLLNYNKIDWYNLSSNINPEAIKLLKKILIKSIGDGFQKIHQYF
jgi:hypothetical protein